MHSMATIADKLHGIASHTAPAPRLQRPAASAVQIILDEIEACDGGLNDDQILIMIVVV
jgi:hypothetical protein